MSDIDEIEAWIRSLWKLPEETKQRIRDACKRYEKCRDSRPLVHTMQSDDPLTVGDLRQIDSALWLEGFHNQQVTRE